MLPINRNIPNVTVASLLNYFLQNLNLTFSWCYYNNLWLCVHLHFVYIDFAIRSGARAHMRFCVTPSGMIILLDIL